MILAAIRDRANIRRFEFDCIIRIYSDFASTPRVRKFTWCFEVSRSVYKNGPLGRQIDTHRLKVMTILAYYTAYLHVITLTLTRYPVLKASWVQRKQNLPFILFKRCIVYLGSHLCLHFVISWAHQRHLQAINTETLFIIFY